MKTISCLAVSAACIVVAAPVVAQEITINSFGGAYEEAHRLCVIDPFEAATGARVNIVTAYSAEAFAQLRAQKDAPQYDVIHFSGGQEIVGAQEGLLLPMTEEMVPNLADVYEFAREGIATGEGPAYQITPVGLVYASGALDAAPTRWADLMNPDYSDRVVLTDITNGYGMIALLMLNRIEGGSLDDIQPGLDAVEKLLEQGAVMISTSPELQAEFAQNDAWLAAYAADYASTLIAAGLDIEFILAEEGTPASFITASLVAGRDNVELASQFVDLELSPEAQACFAAALNYTPTNAETVLEGEVAQNVIHGADAVEGMLRFDPVAIEDHRSEWTEAWGRTIAH